jgi:uncharacterized protein YraI
MVRKLGLLALLLALILSLVSVGRPAAQAQGGDNPWTTYELNMRTGPGGQYALVTLLPPNTPLVLEARNDDISWVLGHTEDGAYRGWVAAIYLTYPLGYAAARLPVSGEIVGAPAAPAAQPAPEGQAPPESAPAASGESMVYTSYELNVRSGPGTNYSAVAVVPGGVGLIPEARNGDGSWILAHTTDGSVRGWLASLYLRFVGISAAGLPYSQETVGIPAGGASTTTTGQVPSTTGGVYEGIIMGSFDPSTVAGIDLAAVPIVGHATGTARSIFLKGRDMGRNPNVLAKVGDCSTEHWYFLKQFAWGQYDLGDYGYLQGVISNFGESLAYDSLASHNGYNVNSVMNPDWADPSMCQSGESPMDCEYRVHNPSVAIIMFGTSDLLSMSAYEFDFYLRDIVRITEEEGIVPILSTFPGNLGFPNHTILYNQIVVRIAMDNDIPLINLWLALESLPNHGLEPDGFHLGLPPGDTSGVLVGGNLQYGYPVRNLVTLQTLDAVWRGAMQ